MKMHDMLYGIAFISGLLGCAGLVGYIEFGTGLVTCVVLIAICGVTSILGMLEDGILKQKNRTQQPTKAQRFYK
jgi:hypothetical protein